MSSPPPASTSPAGSLPASTTATTSVAAITSPSAPPSTPAVYTPEQMSGVINDLVTAVQGIRLYLISSQGPPAPMQPPAATTAASAPWLPALPGATMLPPPPPALPWPAWPPPITTGPAPTSASGVPIQQVRFPPSPSPLPAWINASSSPAPVYSVAGDPPRPTLPDATAAGHVESSAGRVAPYAQGVAAPTPPRFAKLDFATFDGSEDPLNWLNQCEQFFRGQRTLASDRTWLASYHLRGAAQTWYYSLERDEGGMPPWDRFGSSDFAERFQALACHAPGVTGQQRAELFIGGLPDHIRVDVELQAPQDLQTAMHYARAYERRAQAMPPSPPSRGGRPAARPPPPAARPDRPNPTAPPAPAPAATRTFRRLTPAEQLERRRLGLCFNCDEPYAPGHICPRLFYLETVDDFEADTLAEPPAPPEPATTTAPATAFVVSLHALAGIRHERTMLLPVTIRGENLCHGLAQHVPLTIGDEHFTITCAGIDLGCFDFILGVDFLRTLGPILWDFDTLTMTFWRQGRRVQWEGIGGTAPAPQLQLATTDSEAEHPLLTHLLQQHGDLFDEPQGLPPVRVYDHRIHLLPDTAPVAVRPYRYPQLQKDELERQCALMLAAGIIRISTSPFSAPVLLVRKSDAPRARFFTKLDLRSGYHQVRMHPEDIAKTAFRTHHGHFEFLVMPFGLTNAPATFQALMNDVLRPYLPPLGRALQHIAIVFNELRAHHLHLKRSKCSFGTSSVAYLGHVISAEGVAMDADKVAAVAAWPVPHSPRALRGFLGLAGYYRKFIRDYGLIAAPLTRLLRRGGFGLGRRGYLRHSRP
nr:uncharacterized protein LOC127331041 [Lolium perenne]